MLSLILRSLTSALVILCFATSAMADTGTPVMNVSGQGSDYIFVYQGNDTATYADLSALGNSIIGWTATCTSGSCTVGDVLYVGGVGGNVVGDGVSDVGDGVGESVGNSVGDGVGDPVGDGVGDGVRNSDV